MAIFAVAVLSFIAFIAATIDFDGIAFFFWSATFIAFMAIFRVAVLSFIAFIAAAIAFNGIAFFFWVATFIAFIAAFIGIVFFVVAAFAAFRAFRDPPFVAFGGATAFAAFIAFIAMAEKPKSDDFGDVPMLLPLLETPLPRIDYDTTRRLH